MLEEASSCDHILLGDTGLSVSRLCFGTLTIGALQAGLSLDQGIKLLCEAYDRGVNFYDSAASYNTYSYLRALIAAVGRESLIITSKSYAVTATEAEQALHQALNEMATPYIDIFMLHEQLSAATLEGHNQALEYYLKAKKQGLIRSVGLSTHHIAAVRSAIMRPEIEVIEAICNSTGFGIQDGTMAEMLIALEENRLMGKGICAIKILGGGHLIPQCRESISWATRQKSFHSLIIGMQNSAELRINLALLMNEEVSKEDIQLVSQKRRELHIADYCQRCGLCAARCPTGALSFSEAGLIYQQELCFTCGYCGGVCPHLAIKVF
ncbi:MAG: aldo/keto reductase [Symbiobacteriaceae bacterium]|nr:aldo/keto reductase [Symbiobacteriaceae bacterium]